MLFVCSWLGFGQGLWVRAEGQLVTGWRCPWGRTSQCGWGCLSPEPWEGGKAGVGW